MRLLTGGGRRAASRRHDPRLTRAPASHRRWDRSPRSSAGIRIAHSQARDEPPPRREGDATYDTKVGSVATILAHDARGRWASSARLTAHAALSNKSAMTTAWPRI